MLNDSPGMMFCILLLFVPSESDLQASSFSPTGLAVGVRHQATTQPHCSSGILGLQFLLLVVLASVSLLALTFLPFASEGNLLQDDGHVCVDLGSL